MFANVLSPYICWEFGGIPPLDLNSCFLRFIRQEITPYLGIVYNFKIILERLNQPIFKAFLINNYMEDQYKVKVNDELEYQLNSEDLSSLDALATSPKSYHVLIDNQPFTAEILKADFHKKKYELRINNNRYSITIEDSLDLLIEQMGFALSSSRNISSIEAPMPGLILEISVKEGQEVKEDDPLLILEAMKMENVITSPREGIIKSIQVSQGDAVDKDNLLIEFE